MKSSLISMIQNQSQSFFDDIDAGLNWNYGPLPNFSKNNTFTCPVIKIKQHAIVKRVFSLFDGYMIEAKDDSTFKWLDITNSTIEQLESSQYGTGIQISKNGSSFKFYPEAENMYHYLKKFCIQRDIMKTYKMVKQIGDGKFGQVFLCQKKTDGSYYACKVLKKHKSADFTEKSALLKELAIHRSIESDHIVRFFETYESNDKIYIVLEYCQEGDLSNYMAKSTIPNEQKLAKITHQLLLALDYLHRQGLLHRDIKPENILLKRGLDQICLGDLGLSDYYNPKGKYLFTRCGTPGFVAPELLQDKHYDYKIDIYSVGLLMFYLSTGEPPFKGDADSIVIKNYHGAVKMHKLSLSEDGMNLIQSMLSLNPKQRPTAKEALKHPWFAKNGVQVPFKWPLHLKIYNEGSAQGSGSQHGSPNTPYVSPSPRLIVGKLNLNSGQLSTKTSSPTDSPLQLPSVQNKTQRRSIFTLK